VRVEDVEISRADTDLTTFCLGAFASRPHLCQRQCGEERCDQRQAATFEQAGEMLEANPQDLLSRDGKIFVKGAKASR